MTHIKAELRREVIIRAENCCEYCLLSQIGRLFSFDLDHILSEKHGGLTQRANLCLSCPTCNTFKGSDIASVDPQTGLLTWLYNPRRQKWTDHFRLNGAIIEPLSPEGRVTVFLLRFNDPERVAERQELINAGEYPCKSA